MYFPELENIADRSPAGHLVDAFDSWLASLLPAERHHLVPGSLSRDLDVPVDYADDLFAMAVGAGLLRIRYVVVCPHCEEVVDSAYTLKGLRVLSDRLRCAEGFSFLREDEPDSLRVLFELTKGPNRFASKKGAPSRPQPDKLARLAGNPLFQAYGLDQQLSAVPDVGRLRELLAKVHGHQNQTNKERGDALQELAEYLYGLVYCFRVVPTVRTDTSEMDLVVQVLGRPCPHGVLDSLAPMFNVECRNHSEPVNSFYIYGATGRAIDHQNTALVILSRLGFTSDAHTVSHREGGARKDLPVLLVDVPALDKLLTTPSRPFLSTLSDWFYAAKVNRRIT